MHIYIFFGDFTSPIFLTDHILIIYLRGVLHTKLNSSKHSSKCEWSDSFENIKLLRFLIEADLPN